MSIMQILLAMQLFMGVDEGCKVQYRLMEKADWYVLDASGLEQYEQNSSSMDPSEAA